MDRNDNVPSFRLRPAVATREGGVDRNIHNGRILCDAVTSPPARVAWIETYVAKGKFDAVVVATREGGVDRNMTEREIVSKQAMSPPARVAWIETSSAQCWPRPPARSPPARVAWIETSLKR